MTTTTAPYSPPRPRRAPESPASESAARPRAVRELEYHSTLIRNMPSGERPRERLRDAGAAALSDSELLAILLRTGTQSESVLDLAKRLLSDAGGLDGIAKMSHAQLCRLKGFGEAKASQLLAAVALGQRIASLRVSEKPVVRSPQDVDLLLRLEMARFDKEHFRVLVLDTKNRVLAMDDVFVGSVNAATIRTAEVFREAVLRNAPGIIIAHNHPSGDPTPSAEDITVTRELAKAAKLLDIELLDHVVVGRESVVSLKQMNALTPDASGG